MNRKGKPLDTKRSSQPDLTTCSLQRSLPLQQAPLGEREMAQSKRYTSTAAISRTHVGQSPLGSKRNCKTLFSEFIQLKRPLSPVKVLTLRYSPSSVIDGKSPSPPWSVWGSLAYPFLKLCRFFGELICNVQPSLTTCFASLHQITKSSKQKGLAG
jgi:hypothetical protein